MVALLFVTVCAMVLAAVLVAAGQWTKRSPLPTLVLGGFALRIVLSTFLREVPFFSHVSGGDCDIYEQLGRLIATLWKQGGFRFVTSDLIPEMGPTSLPPNLFAFVTYLNGGVPSRVGAAALVALAAGLCAVNLYTLAVQFGAERRNAVLFTALIYFQPAFLFYTSDVYKDGFVLCFALGALGSALRLAFRFSLLHALVGLVCVAALWFVRFYLVYVTMAPLLVGVVGVGTRSTTRSVLAILALAIVAVGLAAFTDILQVASDRASRTFEVGTSTNVLESNAQGGSGVVFDDGGSPFGALPQKLAYTLFSPFFWARGSFGFQVGKLDVCLWYFTLYRAYQAIRHVDRRLLLMLMAFVVPCTVLYALSMANVGLIVRQRLVIVAATSLLASLRPTPVRRARLKQTETRKLAGRPRPSSLAA